MFAKNENIHLSDPLLLDSIDSAIEICCRHSPFDEEDDEIPYLNPHLEEHAERCLDAMCVILSTAHYPVKIHDPVSAGLEILAINDRGGTMDILSEPAFQARRKELLERHGKKWVKEWERDFYLIESPSFKHYIDGSSFPPPKAKSDEETVSF